MDNGYFGSAVIWLAAAIGSHAVGSEPVFPKDVSFPVDRESWVNSPPISAKGLGQKAAFLVFFEET